MEQSEFSQDFRQCIDFHGHVCPGLSIGYRAARAALDNLQSSRAEDEELLAIVETDACGVDAVQVVTGCTLGKGNLVFKDLGKQAFTFVLRSSRHGVRLVKKPEAFNADPRHRELLDKVRAGQASNAEQQEFTELHQRASRQLLDMPLEDLFSWQEGQFRIPDKARIEPSECCAKCGESTMISKLVCSADKLLCQTCAEQVFSS